MKERVRRLRECSVGSFRGFLRITTLFGLLAASLSAFAMDGGGTDRERLPGEKAMAAARNAEDCVFYARAYEEARAAESRLRIDEARAGEATRSAEAAVRACAASAGLDFETTDEYAIARVCGVPYDRWILAGVELRTIDEELGRLSATSEDLALVSENRCGLRAVRDR
jgi:hypothetical protein